MKKSVYELEEQEMTKFKEEFYNTALGKKKFKDKKFSTAVMVYSFLIFFVMVLISIVVGSISGKEIIIEDFFLYDILIMVLTFGLIAYIYNSIVLKIYFYRWLKIKHNIEY